MTDFNEISIGGGNYVKPSECQAGQTWEGFYVESKPSQNFPDQLNHKIRLEDGSSLSFNGSGKLDSLFEQVKPGQFVRVTYKGKIKLERGKFAGKMAHDWALGVAANVPTQDVQPAKQETPTITKPAQPSGALF